jgi:hypothetical protein
MSLELFFTAVAATLTKRRPQKPTYLFRPEGEIVKLLILAMAFRR